MSDSMPQSLHEQLHEQQLHEQQSNELQLTPLPQTSQSTTVDNLTCQWTNCGERASSPEALYEHVCERHVGRKSTNNLNLTCSWGQCRTQTVKRDHITSHIRVHVPLKPHKCDFCGKSFKRPQDLKKHVKTHADDSVLLQSPGANGLDPSRTGSNGQNGKMDGAYYNAGPDMSAPYPTHHQNSMGGSSANFFQQPQQQYSGYGQVNYPQTSSLADQQSMDTRRRAIEALNEFLGDVKRRALDPGNYYDVGQRLQSTSLPLPVSIGSGYSLGSSGYGNGSYNAVNNLLDAYGGSAGGITAGGNPMGQGALTQSYALPMPNARTKTDLVDIDRFLEQLQATVYETSNSAAAAGVQQPGVHAQFPNAHYEFNNNTQTYRSSNSPPQMQNGGSAGITPLSTVPNLGGLTSNTGALDTPALTPSATSYASASHSPMSNHSRSSMGSINGANMYPSLPAVTATSAMGGAYTSAPPSGLASTFEGFDGRRYSGGRLQRQAPERRDEQDATSDAMDLDEDRARTPRRDTDKTRPETSSLDPALRSTPRIGVQSPDASTPTQSDGSDEKVQEAWVENIRVIEQLRKWIGERLAQKDYEREGDDDSTPEVSDVAKAGVEQLRQDEEARQRLQQALLDPQIEQNELDAEHVAYPSLKTE